MSYVRISYGKVGYYVGRSDRKVGSSVGISLGTEDENLEGSPLREKSLGAEIGTEVGSYTLLSDGSVEIKSEGSSGESEKGALGKGECLQGR